MRVQTPLEKLSGLTWKSAPLIFKFSKPPFTFETPKVNPPFSKGGGDWGSSYGISPNNELVLFDIEYWYWSRLNNTIEIYIES